MLFVMVMAVVRPFDDRARSTAPCWRPTLA
jgi:hypothetical protein